MADHKKQFNALKTSIAPWLKVSDGVKALAFYQAAFGAEIKYLMDTGEGGLVAKLGTDSAEFWISADSGMSSVYIANSNPDAMRLILTVADPDSLFLQALNAGATQIYPVKEEYGWRVGRIEDPFGFHWEIGRPVHDH